jgi:pimeloyl-ACP methyl ester carboxylesterase
MQAYQRACGAVIERYEGHVAQYLGDGLMTYFGWPTAHEDDPERAIRVGLEIIEAVKPVEAPTPLQVRVGIATGAVVVGETGAGDASVPKLAVGETPNLAARVQGLAGADEIVIAATTRRLVGAAFALDDLGEHRLKGLAEPVRAWRVTAIGRAEGRFEAARGARLTPLVGRDEELDLLVRRWELAKEGEGQAVLLGGEPGVGKSRVVQAFHGPVADEPHTRLRYQCSPFHSNSAFYPFAEQLTRAAGIRREDSAEEKLDKLKALVSLATVDEGAVTPVLASLLSIPSGRRQADHVGPQQQKDKTIEALAEQLAGLSQTRPVLLIFEDLHWIDPTSLEVLDLLVERVQDLRVLAVFTFRPEFVPSWCGQAHVTSLTVNRLSRRMTTAMVAGLCGEKALPEEVVSQIVEKTDGVPLFVEELTSTVLESGFLTDAGDRLEVSGPLPELSIPVTLQDSLAARLDRLAEAKEVAQVGAAIGRDFSHDLLAAVLPLAGSQLDHALEKLTAFGLIQRHGTPPRASYSFKQTLIQDAAYASLLKSKRQEIHARIATTIEKQSPDLGETQPETLARHFTEAGLGESAAGYWLRAGQRTMDRYANLEARSHLQSGLDALGEIAAQELRTELTVRLGDVASRMGELERANDCYTQALDVAADAESRSRIENKRHRPHAVVRDGAEIAYYLHGSGDETLLFVNPIVYGLATIQPILEHLCQEFRIVTIDCRGTGASDPLVRPYPLSQHVEDLRAVIEALDSGPVIGIGISRGGNQLLKLAESDPRLIGKLVLIGTPIGTLGMDSRFAPSATYMEKRVEALARDDPRAVLALHIAEIFTEPDTRHIAEQFLKAGMRLPKETVASFYDLDPELDIKHLLSSIEAPTLVTHGTADRLIPYAAAEYIAEHLPNARLYPFADKGHLPIFTATGEFCEVVREFVREGPARG